MRKRADYAGGIIGPAGGRIAGSTMNRYGYYALASILDRADAHDVAAVGAGQGGDAQIQRTRQDMTAVIIGMFTD